MKTVSMKLAHNYSSPLAAAVAATVQLQQRGLTATIKDAIEQDALPEIAAAWAELVEFHGADSKEVAILRQTLNRVSKAVKGYSLTCEVHHNEWVCVKAKARKKSSSVKTLSKQAQGIAKLAESRTEAEKIELLKSMAQQLGLEVRISRKPVKKAA